MCRRDCRSRAAPDDEVRGDQDRGATDLQRCIGWRERLVSQRTGIINQIRAFMLERGIAVRQGIGFLRTELPTILATAPMPCPPRMVACPSRTWQAIGAGWIRASMAYPARSKHWPVKIKHVSA